MKKIGIVILSFVVFFVVLSLVSNRTYKANPQISAAPIISEDGYFSQFLMLHQNDFLIEELSYVIPCTEMILEVNQICETDSYDWLDDNIVTVDVHIEQSGLYAVMFDYTSQTTTHLPITIAMSVNGVTPYYEASQITLRTLWTEKTFDLATDRYGNDVSSEQEVVNQSQQSILRDSEYLYEALYIYLEEGDNTISFEKEYGELLLHTISLYSTINYPSYDEYLSMFNSNEPINYYEQIQAEEATYKNSSMIVRGVSRDPLVEPFSLTKLKLNILGTDTYNIAGDRVTWTPDISEAGWYYVTFKVKQDTDFRTMYRTLYVNGEIPFEEVNHVAFPFSDEWHNVTISSLDGNPYKIYLAPGDNLSLEVDSTVFRNNIDYLKATISEISDLGLDVIKLTKNNTDPGIDWDIPEYFPTLESDLQGWIDDIETVISHQRLLDGYSKDSQIIQDLQAAIDKLIQIKSDMNELPRMLTVLSTGSSSALQLISTQLDALTTQKMEMDAVYITSIDQDIPDPTPSSFQSIWVGVERFFLSFFDSSYEEHASEEELEVWVNRSRQYADVIQQLADKQFTPESGVKVKVSIINNDGKLLLANSANQQPDVALGVSAWIPNEYGMRGMLYDLTKANDFTDTISVFHDEQLVPMTYNNSLYGLPETENFYVLFYRKDILVDELGLEVPNTWNDVLDILPTLNRYGMSFYVPLSNANAFKSFDATAPFIYQFGGEIYSSDGFGVELDSVESLQALEFMTDLYTEYGTPVQISSFFNSFRYGTVPIGIGDFGMYLQLTNAASDIRGLWDIALVPGVEHEVYNQETSSYETVINRSMPGAQQASVIFEKSDKKDDAWKFLQWWMATDTQTTYSETLINTLGSRYIWNSANVEAFTNLRINEEHKSVILEQWTNLKETQKIPGSYIIEREISNVWNSVVYEDANLRSAVSDATIKINKEINRKMVEFGYLDTDGTIQKDFILPTKQTIESWYNDEED